MKTTAQQLRILMNGMSYVTGPAVLWDKDKHVVGAVFGCRSEKEARAIYDMLAAYMAFTVDLLDARTDASAKRVG